MSSSRANKRLNAALSEIERLKSERGRLVGAYRQSLIERVLDLAGRFSFDFTR